MKVDKLLTRRTEVEKDEKDLGHVQDRGLRSFPHNHPSSTGQSCSPLPAHTQQGQCRPVRVLIRGLLLSAVEILLSENMPPFRESATQLRSRAPRLSSRLWIPERAIKESSAYSPSRANELLNAPPPAHCSLKWPPCFSPACLLHHSSVSSGPDTTMNMFCSPDHMLHLSLLH